MRRAARLDDNHPEIVAAFKKLGCSVLDIHGLKNCGDLVVSRNMKTAIVEIKDGRKNLAARKLTKGEEKFRTEWQGLYFLVEDLSDVIALVRALEK